MNSFSSRFTTLALIGLAACTPGANSSNGNKDGTGGNGTGGNGASSALRLDAVEGDVDGTTIANGLVLTGTGFDSVTQVRLLDTNNTLLSAFSVVERSNTRLKVAFAASSTAEELTSGTRAVEVSGGGLAARQEVTLLRGEAGSPGMPGVPGAAGAAGATGPTGPGLPNGCVASDVAKFDGTNWYCAIDESNAAGGAMTYTAGTGLQLVGSQFSVRSLQNQAMTMSSNSDIFSANLHLLESGDDFARITFDNDVHGTGASNFWTIAGYAGPSSASSVLNIYYRRPSGEGGGGADIMSVHGNGEVTVPTKINTAWLAATSVSATSISAVGTVTSNTVETGSVNADSISTIAMSGSSVSAATITGTTVSGTTVDATTLRVGGEGFRGTTGGGYLVLGILQGTSVSCNTVCSSHGYSCAQGIRNGSTILTCADTDYYQVGLCFCFKA